MFPIGSYFPAQVGGPSNTIYWLARGLHQHNHEVYVGTTHLGIHDTSIVFNKWLKRDSGNVLYQRTLIIYLPVILFFKLINALRKVELVHLTNVFYPLSWSMACWIIFTWRKQKILWSVRGEFDDAALRFSPIRKKVALFFIKAFLKNKVVFHSTSDVETTCIYNRLGKEVQVIQLPNFIILPVKLEMPVQKTILYLGRLHPIKAIDHLIIGFSKIVDKRGFRLVIAGDGDPSYVDELRKLSKDHQVQDDIDFLGHIDGEGKQKLLASAYVLVLPSHTENFGNVVLEALAQGTPVIASRNTPWSVLEQIAEGSWIYNDPDSIQKAIQKAIDYKPDVYQHMREQALKLCHETFSIEGNISRWESAYEQLLKK